MFFTIYRPTLRPLIVLKQLIASRHYNNNMIICFIKEFYKDKSCDSCRYSIALDFSGDGWHNLCGNSIAPCTCFHNKCEYYKHDNLITKAIKDYYAEKEQNPNLDKWVIEGLKTLRLDVYADYPNFVESEKRDAEKVINILKVIGI